MLDALLLADEQRQAVVRIEPQRNYDLSRQLGIRESVFQRVRHQLVDDQSAWDGLVDAQPHVARHVDEEPRFARPARPAFRARRDLVAPGPAEYARAK